MVTMIGWLSFECSGPEHKSAWKVWSFSYLWYPSHCPVGGHAPTIVMAGPVSSARWRPGLGPPLASIPSADLARSTPTTQNVPMFPQDVRDVMMSAPAEMERTSLTTEWGKEVTSRHSSPLQEANTDPHPPKCVTTNVSQMEAALPPMLDLPEVVELLEAVLLMTLVEAVLEHQMNVKIATKCCLVLQKKSKNQLLILDTQEVVLFKTMLNFYWHFLLDKRTRNCDYKCNPSGTKGDRGCTVRYIGPNRPGQISGSCFPNSFGGSCPGTPPECQDCNKAIFCWW